MIARSDGHVRRCPNGESRGGDRDLVISRLDGGKAERPSLVCDRCTLACGGSEEHTSELQSLRHLVCRQSPPGCSVLPTRRLPWRGGYLFFLFPRLGGEKAKTPGWFCDLFTRPWE